MWSFTHNWTNLLPQQLGRFDDYLLMVKLPLHALDIDLPEIDDRGIDFVVGPSVCGR